MLEKNESSKSRQLAIKLLDTFVRERQQREFFVPKDTRKDLEKLGLQNLVSQTIDPRKRHLAKIKRVKEELEFPDIVTLLVMMELPALEISTLLHRLSTQLMEDAEATFFSKENQACNCGCGCGCCCAAMMDMPYEQRINTHMDAKPYSIDPFNELEMPERERDSLLVRDFLDSFHAISNNASELINLRYFEIGKTFQ
jgi:hypothetical protein